MFQNSYRKPTQEEFLIIFYKLLKIKSVTEKKSYSNVEQKYYVFIERKRRRKRNAISFLVNV